jgi:hypothetical protein
MQGSRVLMALVGLSVTALIGCEASIDSMTVYALDGEFTPGISKPRPGETFHDYPVLGKTEVAGGMFLAASRRESGAERPADRVFDLLPLPSG